tara:strand:- start:626 stop:922 length:297 start_codon:yes stop_codon:yes gene_type:complete
MTNPRKRRINRVRSGVLNNMLKAYEQKTYVKKQKTHEKIKIEEENIEKTTKEVAKNVKDYSTMSYTELKKEAKLAGIKNYFRKKKVVLIEELENISEE